MMALGYFAISALPNQAYADETKLQKRLVVGANYLSLEPDIKNMFNKKAYSSVSCIDDYRYNMISIDKQDDDSKSQRFIMIDDKNSDFENHLTPDGIVDSIGMETITYSTDTKGNKTISNLKKEIFYDIDSEDIDLYKKEYKDIYNKTLDDFKKNLHILDNSVFDYQNMIKVKRNKNVFGIDLKYYKFQEGDKIISADGFSFGAKDFIMSGYIGDPRCLKIEYYGDSIEADMTIPIDSKQAKDFLKAIIDESTRREKEIVLQNNQEKQEKRAKKKKAIDDFFD